MKSRMIKEIIIVTGSYPTRDDPVYTFIRPVACGLADLGIKVLILSPQSVTNALKRKVKIRPFHWVDLSDKGNRIDVYQPKHISVSMLKLNGQLLSQRLFERALKRGYKRIKRHPDLVYAHFWESVVAAHYVIKNDDIPLIAVSGEEHVSVYETYPVFKVNETVKDVNGLICVSTKNLEECRSLNLTNDHMRTVVLPNSIDNTIFHQLDRNESRKKLDIPLNKPIAAFVGEFSNRKGVNRLIEASRAIPSLGLILIGCGEPLMHTDQIIFSGKLPHEEIPVYLNAADFFVLPTLAEGCCNAIVEALACGLPIVSSDRSFNYDILNSENSLLVDPQNIDEITNAMRRMTEEPDLRKKLSEGALKTARDLRIEHRVRKISEFIEMVFDHKDVHELQDCVDRI